MNKKTRAMMKDAERHHVMWLVPISATDCKSLSHKAAGIQYCDPSKSKDSYVLEAQGSPADMRKIIKYVEKLDIIPLYEERPIFREGRTYNLLASEGFWAVSRVMDNGIENTVEPYDEYATEIDEFDIYEFIDENCEEAIRELGFEF